MSQTYKTRQERKAEAKAASAKNGLANNLAENVGCAIYTRVSTEDQAKHYSLDYQEQQKMVYAKIKDKKAQRKDPKEKIDMLQSLLRSFSTCFVEASMSEKAEICHLLFNGIIFDVENRKVTAFIPNEDFLLLFELIADQNHWKIEIQDDKKVFILL